MGRRVTSIPRVTSKDFRIKIRKRHGNRKDVCRVYAANSPYDSHPPNEDSPNGYYHNNGNFENNKSPNGNGRGLPVSSPNVPSNCCPFQPLLVIGWYNPFTILKRLCNSLYVPKIVWVKPCKSSGPCVNGNKNSNNLNNNKNRNDYNRNIINDNNTRDNNTRGRQNGNYTDYPDKKKGGYNDDEDDDEEYGAEQNNDTTDHNAYRALGGDGNIAMSFKSEKYSASDDGRFELYDASESDTKESIGEKLKLELEQLQKEARELSLPDLEFRAVKLQSALKDCNSTGKKKGCHRKILSTILMEIECFKKQFDKIAAEKSCKCNTKKNNTNISNKSNRESRRPPPSKEKYSAPPRDIGNAGAPAANMAPPPNSRVHGEPGPRNDYGPTVNDNCETPARDECSNELEDNATVTDNYGLAGRDNGVTNRYDRDNSQRRQAAESKRESNSRGYPRRENEQTNYDYGYDNGHSRMTGGNGKKDDQNRNTGDGRNRRDQRPDDSYIQRNPNLSESCQGKGISDKSYGCQNSQKCSETATENPHDRFQNVNTNYETASERPGSTTATCSGQTPNPCNCSENYAVTGTYGTSTQNDPQSQCLKQCEKMNDSNCKAKCGCICNCKCNQKQQTTKARDAKGCKVPQPDFKACPSPCYCPYSRGNKSAVNEGDSLLSISLIEIIAEPISVEEVSTIDEKLPAPNKNVSDAKTSYDSIVLRCKENRMHGGRKQEEKYSKNSSGRGARTQRIPQETVLPSCHHAQFATINKDYHHSSNRHRRRK